MQRQNKCKKQERLCNRRQIDELFKPGSSKSMMAYPLRVVYHTNTDDVETSQFLISVPKRYFKHAVDRNHVKRQVREAYRTNKHLLKTEHPVVMAFIWLDSKHHPTETVRKKVVNLLHRINEAVIENEIACELSDVSSQHSS